MIVHTTHKTASSSSSSSSSSVSSVCSTLLVQVSVVWFLCVFSGGGSAGGRVAGAATEETQQEQQPQHSVDGALLETLEDFDRYYDDNGHLSRHLLLYPAACADTIETQIGPQYGRTLHPLSAALEQLYFGTTFANSTTAASCNAVCVERGLDRTLIHYPMPQYYYQPKVTEEDDDEEEEEEECTMEESAQCRIDGRRKKQPGQSKTILRSMLDQFTQRSMHTWFAEECNKVSQGFVNYYDMVHEIPVDIYYVDKNGKRFFNQHLEFGGQKQSMIGTYLGHRFDIVDPQTNETILEHVVEYNGCVSIGTYTVPKKAKEDVQINMDQLVHDTLNREWKGHYNVKHSFSALGFAKGRLPQDVYGQMDAYHYNNRPNMYCEEWDRGNKGYYVNWWETDVSFMDIPWTLKKVWQLRLLQLVEDWVGGETKLEQTSMYGIRQYEKGARLLTHVDRVTTHAASLIVNVAQMNVAEPWRVEIHDHADRLHEIVMAPGDVVYYESARCLHARNTPLVSGSYANIFTHYRPIGDPQWYQKKNNEHTPARLLDVGECQRVGKRNAYSQGSVVCDDTRIGPHLSPTRFVATSGDDLFHWWKHMATGKPVNVGVPGETIIEEEDDDHEDEAAHEVPSSVHTRRTKKEEL